MRNNLAIALTDFGTATHARDAKVTQPTVAADGAGVTVDDRRRSAFTRRRSCTTLVTGANDSDDDDDDDDDDRPTDRRPSLDSEAHYNLGVIYTGRSVAAGAAAAAGSTLRARAELGRVDRALVHYELAGCRCCRCRRYCFDGV